MPAIKSTRNDMETVPPAAWMQPLFSQTMDWTQRRLVPQSFMIPGVGAMENTPICLLDTHAEVSAPEMLAETNTTARKFSFLVIRQIVNNWKSIAALWEPVVRLYQKCSNWISEYLDSFTW